MKHNFSQYNITGVNMVICKYLFEKYMNVYYSRVSVDGFFFQNDAGLVKLSMLLMHESSWYLTTLSVISRTLYMFGCLFGVLAWLKYK